MAGRWNCGGLWHLLLFVLVENKNLHSMRGIVVQGNGKRLATKEEAGRATKIIWPGSTILTCCNIEYAKHYFCGCGL